MSQGDERGVPTVREEVFKVKPGLFHEFIEKAKNPFSFSSIGEEGRELKIIKNLLCTRGFTFIISGIILSPVYI